MILPVGRKLPKSGLYIPESATTNKDLDWRRPRTIWTADGEIEVPTKRRPSRGRYQSVLRARVRAIWVRDERGQLLVWDPHGSLNTITGGAGWAILQALFGINGNPHASSVSVEESIAAGAYTSASYISGNVGVPVVAYNDGTYNFPTLAQIGVFYNGTNTYYLGWEIIRPVYTLFGQVWLLHGASGGLTGSHIPASVTTQMGSAGWDLNTLAGDVQGLGWQSGSNYALPGVGPGTPVANGTTMTSPNTSVTDNFSVGTSGTPYMEHNLTYTLSSSGTAVTFDSVAWVPIVGLGASSGTAVSQHGWGSYWAAGSPVTTGPTWGSGSTTPTSISNLQVAALWVIGFTVSLSPGQSFGFTYTFQG